MDIITPKRNETYKEYIDRILSSRENKKDKNLYQEKHHIIPKTLGGNNDANNLIYLYGQEHYYAHKLLAKENPSEKGLQLAWWNMCQCTQHGERKYHIDAEEYAEARQNASQIISENRKGIIFSPEHIQHLCGHGKPVVNITTGEKFNSAKEAHLQTGINHSHIIECCKGTRNSAGKSIDGTPYQWEYQSIKSDSNK